MQHQGQEAREHRRFIWAFLAVSALLLGGVATMSVVVDPSARFGTGLFPPIVWTARAQKVRLLRAQDPPPSALILGSSRVMKVEPSFVDAALHTRSFNAAVSSAMVEDYVAMYRFAVQDLHAPIQTVILGVDVEAFHDQRPPDERLLATPDLVKHVPEMRPAGYVFEQAAAALSYQQARLSLTSLVYGLTAYPTPKTKFDDRGFLTYVVWDRQLREGRLDFDKNVQRSIPEYLGRFAHFTGLSARRKRLLSKLLDQWKRDGVQVFVYLTPLHPKLLAALEAKTNVAQRTAELHAWLAKECAQRSIPFADYTRLEGFPASELRFYDGAHPTAQTNRRLLTDLFQKAGHHAVQ